MNTLSGCTSRPPSRTHAHMHHTHGDDEGDQLHVYTHQHTHTWPHAHHTHHKHTHTHTHTRTHTHTHTHTQQNDEEVDALITASAPYRDTTGRQTFSKASPLVNLLDKTHIELTFENFSRAYSVRGLCQNDGSVILWLHLVMAQWYQDWAYLYDWGYLY